MIFTIIGVVAVIAFLFYAIKKTNSVMYSEDSSDIEDPDNMEEK